MFSYMGYRREVKPLLKSMSKAGESFFKNCVDNGFLNGEDWHIASQKEEYEYLTDCF